jgi:hypothetical protein
VAVSDLDALFSTLSCYRGKKKNYDCKFHYDFSQWVALFLTLRKTTEAIENIYTSRGRFFSGLGGCVAAFAFLFLGNACGGFLFCFQYQKYGNNYMLCVWSCLFLIRHQYSGLSDLYIHYFSRSKCMHAYLASGWAFAKWR